MISAGIIQIAGVPGREKAELPVRAGVDTIGLPLHLVHHWADLSDPKPQK